MKIDLESALGLLHLARHAVLATHSTQLRGFPYATALPYVLDEQHCPVLCMSALAEHSKNLQADHRASMCVIQPDAADVQAGARLTLVGEAEWFEPTPDLLARFLRYEPNAEAHLALDFRFLRLRPRRVRFIGGVGKMGWIEEADWEALPALRLNAEHELIRAIAPKVRNGVRLLGVDCFGIDYETGGKRQRQRLPGAPVAVSGFADILGHLATELA